MQRKVIIEIDKLGKPKITAEGFLGTSCKDATKGLIDALSDGEDSEGVEVEEAPEMHMGDNTQMDYEGM